MNTYTNFENSKMLADLGLDQNIEDGEFCYYVNDNRKKTIHTYDNYRYNHYKYKDKISIRVYCFEELWNLLKEIAFNINNMIYLFVITAGKAGFYDFTDDEWLEDYEIIFTDYPSETNALANLIKQLINDNKFEV